MNSNHPASTKVPLLSMSCGSRRAIGQRDTAIGFGPVTRVVIERKRSTVEFYDYSRRRSEIGIIRGF